ncbi:MAG: hypothetical protein AVDCRST_MAG96-74 [uncultured Segetibacter sp.]|uniref:Uncharacterized protein n=1 Tax=uncultured Segetibacter sp. TaxID=481133 RepID=A0A6J4R7N5_9BACT|nr:MAG: hypothetical protein AVDCRST_MAG96-74 [uncultured Segetibacter sp.]
MVKFARRAVGDVVKEEVLRGKARQAVLSTAMKLYSLRTSKTCGDGKVEFFSACAGISPITVQKNSFMILDSLHRLNSILYLTIRYRG